MAGLTRPIAGALAALCFVAPMAFARSVSADGDGAWAAGTAAELTRQGREHAQAGDDHVAAQRFAEAIQLDPSFGPAYLELAHVRERAGDLGEAERTYGVAIEHVPQFVAAFRARAALYRRMGQAEREIADLEAASRLAPALDLLRELAARYVQGKSWPAALATCRRLLVLSESLGDARAAREASTQIRALAILSAELDPVSAGASSHDWVRRAEASVARRRGM